MAMRRPSIVRLPWAQSSDDEALPGLGGPAPVLPVIDQQLTQMFALVSEAIAGATHALLTGDREAAKSIVAADEQIDEIAIALTFLVEEALVGSGRSAEERRELIALGRILPEIERNGDLAEHIARRAARGLGQEISARARGLVERMGEVAASIWSTTADVAVNRSALDAAAVEDLDDELDDLHVTLIAEVSSGSMPLPVAIELAMVARFYERFGDHAVNLARRMAMVSGSPVAPPSGGAD
jgi:phosphate transport system protein